MYQGPIDDGGLNDADGVVNQSISDPDGVVNQPIVEPVVAAIAPTSSDRYILGFFVGSTNPIWLLMLIVGLLPLRRKQLAENRKKH